ncbi:MAG: tripartite tricarboxylate transporter permease [Candidatus Woesearchaeota archaeon]
MFLEILFAILLGVLAGCFTGLIPGIHVNLIALSLLTFSPFLIGFVSTSFLVCFIVSMAITHSFMSTIPSIFLGAPESSTALGVLPGHRMLLEGKGVVAVKLTVAGSILGLLLCFLLYPFFVFLIDFGYDYASEYMFELLFVISLFLVFRSKSFLFALFIFLSAGAVGYFGLNSNIDNSLFAMLTGFFGVSTLAYSLKESSSYPKQSVFNFSHGYKESFSSLLFGSFSGFITCVLPGLGSSTAATICSLFKSDGEAKNFLFMIGSISTVNFFMSIAALSVIDRARNGAIIVVSSITDANSFLLIASCLIAGGLSVFLCFFISEKFIFFVKKFDYKRLVLFVIFCLVVICFLLCSFTGLFLFFVSFLVGYLCNVLSLPRNLMMACIMVPVIFFIF